MSSFHLRGHDIDFPYPTPYEIQKVYMEKVLTCLDDKTHGVLESPTGTGKTLCLFAPVTAWARRKKAQRLAHVALESNKEFRSQYFDNKEEEQQQQPWGGKKKSKVWYTARTHSQIAQTVSEVRKCNIEGLHVRVMGARDQLCINDTVLEEKDSYVKTVKCKELVKAKKCKYYNKLSYEKDFHRFYQSGDILDIEDLVSMGKSTGICPYFLAKKASESADIVLLPYNYIIDRESRDSNGLLLQNDVIIFDEGHNVPGTCEESYEFSFNSLDVALGIRNIQELMLSLTKLTDDLIEDNEIDVAKHASNSMMMMEILQNLESALASLNASNELLPVSRIYDFLAKAGVDDRKAKQLAEGISSFKSDSEKLSLGGSTLETFNLLEKMINVMFGTTVKSFGESVVDKSFKCGVTIDPERPSVKKFSLFCFNPSFGIKNLLMLGTKSIIITSGTLSPLRTFISELCLPNPVTLENQHIAKKLQVPFLILGTGVNNVKMDGAYKNRTDRKYTTSLGMTLTNLIASVPDGVLLLFSSYTMMQNLKESWESDLGIWTRLNSLKRVFVEPRNKDEFINCMENYRRAIDSGNGAILMGVLRGKISEGMDFKDQYCRGVFIIGVPFPPIQDPRVVGKQKYAESLMIYNPSTKTEEKLYNHPYMSIEAMKTTNQAIGRVIRHGEDYGVIILVDYRFAWPRLFQNISTWLRGDSAIESNFPNAKRLVTEFFRNVHSGKLGIREIRRQPVDSNGCPIASYTKYEEYDRKKAPPRTSGPWIGFSPPEVDETKTGKNRQRQSEAEDDFDISKLRSKYANSNWKNSQSEIRDSIADSKKSDSLLDAIENSITSRDLYYKEYEANNDESNSEKNKRKREEEEGEEEEGKSQKLSPSLFSPPDSSRNVRPKKFSHLKVRPILPASENDSDSFPDPENDFHSSKGSSSSDSNSGSKDETEEMLKDKLIDYYRTTKKSLSTEGDQRFKQTSSRYMKGEIALSEVIRLMDELFLRRGKKNLYAGFRICVKSNDKSEWTKACKKRGIHFS